MTWIAGGLIMLATALVQVTWAPRLTLLGAFPNLVLVVVVAVTWTRGQRAGLLWACAGGLLLDLTAPGPLGPHALALLAGAYLSGYWVRNVEASRVLHAAIATIACTLVYSLVLVGADNLLDLPLPPPGLVVELGVAAAAYNALVIVPVLLAARRLQGRAAA